MIINPEACDRTRERLMLMYAPGVIDNPASLAARNSVRSAWQEVFSEDVAVVESMQRGRNSPAFDGGKFSPVMDPPTHAFHQWTAAQIKKGEC
jgi:choline monooxygenase